MAKLGELCIGEESQEPRKLANMVERLHLRHDEAMVMCLPI